MHVQVNSEQQGAATVVHAAGEVDLHTAATLQAELESAVAAQAPLIVVDLAAVDFMDSTGLSVIVATVAAVREYRGEVRVVTAAGKITKVFTLTGVDQQVGMYATVEEALT
ncbi:MAG: STAS domain-containing protein [Micrococcales bacterium]|nr:STAS domain-containing protein [Micrococcales bacterium]